MKKYIPFIGIGVLILLTAVFFVAKGLKNKTSPAGEEETNVSVLPQSQWPAVTLTPTDKSDVKGSLGHWLVLKVQKINVPGAASMDYLLVYSTSDGGQQGVPGTVALTGSDVERKLLLGSESSGKFRYDAGVSQGTMTLTFRDEGGKSIGRLSTDFHLQTGEVALTSIDGKFTYTLDKIAKDVFFVTMQTFLEPDPSAYVVWQNGYGVFASDGKPHSGKLAQ
ncbi:hypothetical protein A2394_00800 [Candidatus Woesebacteria bacterium RIFOXYB1_FULL_42_36]|nr:MAG: hypothetical protein A2394_00800 [Candidatus Woesebacteria bacterium RIFOXYB1_FULL_42_36]